MREIAEKILTSSDREHAQRLARCFPYNGGHDPEHQLSHYLRMYELAYREQEEELRDSLQEIERLLLELYDAKETIICEFSTSISKDVEKLRREYDEEAKRLLGKSFEELEK